MNRLSVVTALALLVGAAGPATAGDQLFNSALADIRSAALSRNARSVDALFDDAVTLVSQSGKVYDKAAVLADLGGGFEAWDNSDVKVNEQGDIAVVTFINSRKRAQTDAANFRVMQVWKKHGGQWKVLAQSSVRLPAQP